jgi:hypothetical protein
MMQSKAQSIIEEYLASREPQVVKNAARALAALGDDSALAHLVQLATESNFPEAQSAACERLLLLNPEPADTVARKLAVLLKAPARWRAAYQLLAKLDAPAQSAARKEVPVRSRLWLATKASVLFSWERFRKSIAKACLTSLGIAFLAMLTVLISLAPFPQLEMKEADYPYMWGALIPATLAHIASRLVTTSVECHPFRLAAYASQTLIVALLTGLIVATTLLITMDLPDIKLSLSPLSAALTMALSAVASRALALLTREALPKTAAPRATAFSVALLGSASILIYLFARTESSQSNLLQSAALPGFQRGSFVIALITLLTLTFHFAAAEPVPFRGIGRRSTARVVLLAFTAVAIAVVGMGWQRGGASVREPQNEVACLTGGDTPSRFDFYEAVLPVSVAIHVNEDEGLVRVAMPEHKTRTGTDADYAVSVGSRLAGAGSVQLAKDAVDRDDPPEAELEVKRGQYAAEGGVSGFRKKGASNTVPSMPIATSIATRFGTRFPPPKTNWHFDGAQPQLLSVACGQVAWPRVIDTYLQSYPIRPGMQVRAKRLTELRGDPNWSAAMDPLAGKSMTVSGLGIDSKGNQEFYVLENDSKWVAAWVDAIPEPNRPEPTVEVVTPRGRYAPGVKVTRSEGNTRDVYLIKAIRDSHSDKSRSGYDVTLSYSGSNKIRPGNSDGAVGERPSPGDACERTVCVTDLEGWVPVEGGSK